jgi:natural product biosynthesis luciferase-like monooxygenase protein
MYQPVSDRSIVLVGDESLVVNCALAAREQGVGVVCIATSSAAVRSMAETLPEPVRVVASADLGRVLAETPVAALFSVANERVIADDVLAAVPVAVNFHDGPLPARAGLGVTTWAIHDGDEVHGITWHLMTSNVDEGGVVATEAVAIGAADTALQLNAACYAAALRTFPSVLVAVLDGTATIGEGRPPMRWHGRYDRPLVWVGPDGDVEVLARRVRSLALGPRVRNRMGVARLVIGDQGWIVDEVDTTGAPSTPWTARLGRIRDLDGGPVDHPLVVDQVRDALKRDSAASASSPIGQALAARDATLARHEHHWSTQLARALPTVPAQFSGEPGVVAPDWAVLEVGPIARTADDAAALLALWWWRATERRPVWFECSNEQIAARLDELSPLLRAPMGVVGDGGGAVDDVVMTWSTWRSETSAAISEACRRGPFLRDLVARDPAIVPRRTPAMRLVFTGGDRQDGHGATARSAGPASDVCVSCEISDDGTTVIRHRLDLVGTASASAMAEQLEALAAGLGLAGGAAASSDPAVRDRDLRTVSILSDTDRRIIDSVNSTSVPFDESTTIDRLVVAQAERTPDAPAISGPSGSRTYGELISDVRRFSEHLGAAGVGRGDLVGIALPRDVDLLVAVLAIHSVGAAYVPLDPEYPLDRLRVMVDDAGLRVVVADPAMATRLGDGLVVVRPAPADVDEHRAVPSPIAADHDGSDLAYVIYTSGSTGRPKGVMLEHRNVVNFFVAMDAVVESPTASEPGVWLSVTSLSFDISVLELLWTVTRGFHVVVQGSTATVPAEVAPDAGVATDVGADADAPAAPAVSMSLFFFAAGEAQASDGYRLLRESVQVADRWGFEAVWVPERHFHAFGGAYPNPSVIAAAIASITTRVKIRAGSVVLPLHASARVAEEWAVVDNLSGGRVGISFAAGWQPNDFVLNPNGYATARADLADRIAEVQRLWRGESIDMVGPTGDTVAVRTLPRPVQSELPVWLTSAGTRATFERAGTVGTSLLTHLLGQSVDQLAENIGVYRDAWRAAGHPGDGHVTLMLHTFLDVDGDTARARALEPMKAYLGTAAGLIKNLASAFPTFANAGKDADEAFRSLTETELDELLTIAAHRYLETSGLFGTADDAARMVRRVASLGVDEVACLVDFGLGTDEVLDSLHHLVEAKQLVASGGATTEATAASSLPAVAGREAVSALARHHRITHLQCTPSLAAMLVADPGDRAVVAGLRHLMVGGEALPERLAAELRDVVGGRVTNMYGPTETTIWSLVHDVDAVDGPVPIGRPIANTTVHVLDRDGVEVPVGVLGELHLGGAGVARGYLGREELTAERFVERSRVGTGADRRWGRVYATGDLARLRPDGIVEFAGRVDHQVKIRGHRIELGEIEALLDQHPAVGRAVVVARGEAASSRLVAFVQPTAGVEVDADALRAHVAASLPSIMVPDGVVLLDAFPLTPNGKIDRNALPDGSAAAIDAPVTEPASAGNEALVAEVWTAHLQRPVGRNDNFFDIGGHSLSAVAVFRDLQRRTGASIALTDVFRFPTVADFAAHLDRVTAEPGGGSASTDVPTTMGAPVVDRGTLRRLARSGRSTSDR